MPKHAPLSASSSSNGSTVHHQQSYVPISETRQVLITAMTSLLGKTKFNELLGDLIEKPQGNQHLCLNRTSDRQLTRQLMISKIIKRKILCQI